MFDDKKFYKTLIIGENSGNISFGCKVKWLSVENWYNLGMGIVKFLTLYYFSCLFHSADNLKKKRKSFPVNLQSWKTREPTKLENSRFGLIGDT